METSSCIWDIVKKFNPPKFSDKYDGKRDGSMTTRFLACLTLLVVVQLIEIRKAEHKVQKFTIFFKTSFNLQY